MVRFARILVVFMLMPLALQAQDSVYARRVIRDLTAPSMYGRGMQNRGDSIAADYVRNELKTMGVKPLCKNYYQYFHFPNTKITNFTH